MEYHKKPTEAELSLREEYRPPTTFGTETSFESGLAPFKQLQICTGYATRPSLQLILRNLKTLHKNKGYIYTAETLLDMLETATPIDEPVRRQLRRLRDNDTNFRETWVNLIHRFGTQLTPVQAWDKLIVAVSNYDTPTLKNLEKIQELSEDLSPQNKKMVYTLGIALCRLYLCNMVSNNDVAMIIPDDQDVSEQVDPWKKMLDEARKREASLDEQREAKRSGQQLGQLSKTTKVSQVSTNTSDIAAVVQQAFASHQQKTDKKFAELNNRMDSMNRQPQPQMAAPPPESPSRSPANSTKS